MAHRSLISGTWVVVAGLLWGQISAEPVVVVKDKDITPYNQAISGLKETCQAPVKEMDLEKMQQAGTDPLASIKGATPQVIVTLGRKSSDVVAGGIADIPVIVCMDPSPECAVGKKNMSVIPLNVPPAEQFKAMLKVCKNAKRLGVVYSRPDLEPMIAEGKKDAGALGLTLTSKKVANAEEMPGALKEMITAIDLIWVLPDQDIINKDSVRTLILISVDYKLPLLVYSTDFVRSGALMAVIHDYQDTGRKAGLAAKGCVEGKAGEKPLFPETTWAINMHMAERLGIEITPEVKQKAQVFVE